MMASNKRLKYHELHNLAHAIAEKAFEHLTKPLQKELNYIAGQVYERVFTDLGVTQDQIRPFTGENDRAYIMLDNGKGESVEVLYSHKNIVSLSRYDSRVVTDEKLYDAYIAVAKALDPFNENSRDLQNMLREQMDGKTVNQIAKAWPEAAPFMTRWLTPTANMTVPLENLLAKFLPALPAPTENVV